MGFDISRMTESRRLAEPKLVSGDVNAGQPAQPAQAKPAVSGTPARGSKGVVAPADGTPPVRSGASKSSTAPSAVAELISGGSKMATGGPVSQLGPDVMKSFAQAGSLAVAGAVPAAPVVERPSKKANQANPASGAIGGPVASDGPGNGRQPAKAGTTISQTKTRHRGGSLPPGFGGGRKGA